MSIVNLRTLSGIWTLILTTIKSIKSALLRHFYTEPRTYQTQLQEYLKNLITSTRLYNPTATLQSLFMTSQRINHRLPLSTILKNWSACSLSRLIHPIPTQSPRDSPLHQRTHGTAYIRVLKKHDIKVTNKPLEFLVPPVHGTT